MHLCCIVFGKAACIASLIPVNLSEHIINISFIPRPFKSFKTPNQNLADSFSPIQIPNISFSPFSVTPKTIYATFLLLYVLVLH